MGYVNIDVTRGVADWGADVFCEKDGAGELFRFPEPVKLIGHHELVDAVSAGGIAAILLADGNNVARAVIPEAAADNIVGDAAL